MITIHVILALASLVLASLNFARPSRFKQNTSYTLAGGTLTTGVLLVVLNNASLVRTCLSGIMFFAVVTALNGLARKKLAAQALKVEE